MLSQLLVLLYSSFYAALSTAEPVSHPAGVYNGTVNFRGNPFTVTAAFSKTADVIEYLNIMVPTVADITVRGAPYHTVGNNLHINSGSSLPEEYAELDTEIEYHHDSDTVIFRVHDTGVPPVTLHREVDYPHPIDLYAGSVDLNGGFFTLTASLSRVDNLIEGLVINAPGIDEVVIRDVPYYMIGNELHVSHGSQFSEQYTSLAASLEYDYDRDAVRFTVPGFGVLSVTMERVAISRVLKR